MKQEISDMKKDVSEIPRMKQEISDMKKDVSEIPGMKQEISDMKQDISGIHLHLENVTDRKIELLAENHLHLIDKLNEAIRVSDKTLIYETEVAALSEEMKKIKKRIEKIENKPA